MWICCFSPRCASRTGDALGFWSLKYFQRPLCIIRVRCYYVKPLQTKQSTVKYFEFSQLGKAAKKTLCTLSHESQLEKSWWNFLENLQETERRTSQFCGVNDETLRKQAHDILASSESLSLSIEVEKKRQELHQLLQELQGSTLDDNLCHQLEALGNAILIHLESGRSASSVNDAVLSSKEGLIRICSDNIQDKFIRRQPNIFWKSVNKSRLRSHPLYRPLPPPYLIKVESCRDFRMLRQDTEEWKIARSFSQVSASTLWRILGFGERKAATFLGVPSSMKGHHHALYAWKSLMNPSFEEVYDPISKVRMEWGHSHEANCLLAFLEYMHSLQDIRMQEVGLFVLEKEQILPQWNILYEELPTISASPDALFRVRNTNGIWSPWQLCEAKSRCPFVPRNLALSLESSQEIASPNGDSVLGKQKDMSSYSHWSFIHLRPLEKLSPLYFAQMQLQMLCANIEEQGYLISYSVTKGSNVFQVTRNNEWLGACLFFVREFYRRYGTADSNKYPPDDFFWDIPRYYEFLQLTKELTNQCTVWKHIPQEEFDRFDCSQVAVEK
ncbi:hypothetical protein GAYE_PCTG14G0613 [Galdieria yellowstonensis]|uniref:Uncharacterized protein n=1 Tax=Galdieria yellowstonensis TaxID=3028027 RepID=A0AAV9I2W0_9RHOD|nr:hypothetical protein GAYE_PCTG14G0613 [Galdieria yellowstonensis]